MTDTEHNNPYERNINWVLPIKFI